MNQQPSPADSLDQRAGILKMLEADPDLNLYWFAWENPELEEAALALAKECPRCYGTRRLRNLQTMSPSDDEVCPVCAP